MVRIAGYHFFFALKKLYLSVEWTKIGNIKWFYSSQKYYLTSLNQPLHISLYQQNYLYGFNQVKIGLCGNNCRLIYIFFYCKKLYFKCGVKHVFVAQSSINANTNPDQIAFSHFHKARLLIFWWSFFGLMHGENSSLSPLLLVHIPGCEFLYHKHVFSI